MRKSILLIDDDEDESQIFMDALNKTNISFDFQMVSDYDHAATLLTDLVPDYIFVDYNMPKVNGLGCIKEFKKISSLLATSFILYSSTMNSQIIDEAMHLGAKGCMKKQYGTMLANELNNIFQRSEDAMA